MTLINFVKTKKQFFYGLLIAFFVAFFDLLTKRAAFAYVNQNTDSINPFVQITSFFNLVAVWNRGVSFGMFSNHEYSQIIFSLIVAIILVILLIWLYRNSSQYLMCSLAFICGGAIGNLYDRVTLGAVADFLDFHIASYHWPAFNLADSFIFIGVLMLLIEDFILKKND